MRATRQGDTVTITLNSSEARGLSMLLDAAAKGIASGALPGRESSRKAAATQAEKAAAVIRRVAQEA